MANFLSQTLSADGNSNPCTVNIGKHGTFAIDITGTITIAPGDYLFAASGTSGGTAVIRMDEIPAT